MNIFPRQCEEKKKRRCIAFLNYSFNFIEEEMQYERMWKERKEKKKQAKFLLPSELIFFREGGAAYSHGNLFNKKVLR